MQNWTLLLSAFICVDCWGTSWTLPHECIVYIKWCKTDTVGRVVQEICMSCSACSWHYSKYSVDILLWSVVTYGVSCCSYASWYYELMLAAILVLLIADCGKCWMSQFCYPTCIMLLNHRRTGCYVDNTVLGMRVCRAVLFQLVSVEFNTAIFIGCWWRYSGACIEIVLIFGFSMQILWFDHAMKNAFTCSFNTVLW